MTILEVPGGSDKGPDGHRRDSGPLVEAFRRRGWDASIEFYADHDRAALLRRVAAGSDAYISRVNPGSYANYTESLYFDMCRQLARCVRRRSWSTSGCSIISAEHRKPGR